MLGKWQNGMKKLLESKETMLILFLSGILIFVILLPTGNDNDSYETTPQDAYMQEATTNNNNSYYYGDDYKKSLEKELEEFLSGVAGVGDAKVLIYMKASQEYIVEKDKPTTSSESSDSVDKKIDEETVYTVNSAGDQVPFISQTIGPSVDGVVVAAQGATQEIVRLEIMHLVMTLFGIEANKVEVLVLE